MSFDADAAARPNSGVFGLETPLNAARVALIPVPFDATASYGRRAADGPAAILRASHQVDLYDRETGRPYRAGIVMLDESPQVRAWNDEARALCDAARGINENTAERRAVCERVDALCERMNTWVLGEARRLLDAGKLVGVVGGDHSVPLGSIRAHAEKYRDLGILHIDAHADLRMAYEGFAYSHASIMHNVVTQTSVARLVQVGVRDFGEGEMDAIEASSGRIVTFFDSDLAGEQLAGVPFARLAERIVAALPQDVYVSFDIDGLDPTLCPNTGTPVPGGLSFREVAFLLAELRRSGRRIVGFDLTEVAPADDGSEWDANVGARVLYKLIGHAVASTAEAA